MRGLTISQVTDQNTERFINAYLKLFNDENNLLYLSFSNIPFSLVLVQDWVKAAKQSNVEYYIADGEAIEGILIIKFFPTDSFEILALVVREESRGKGIGSRLIEIAEENAREKGFKAVDIAVFTDNRKMLSLVINKGYKPVRIDYHKRFDGEDVIYLKKHLV